MWKNTMKKVKIVCLLAAIVQGIYKQSEQILHNI